MNLHTQAAWAAQWQSNGAALARQAVTGPVQPPASPITQMPEDTASPTHSGEGSNNGISALPQPATQLQQQVFPTSPSQSCGMSMAPPATGSQCRHQLGSPVKAGHGMKRSRPARPSSWQRRKMAKQRARSACCMQAATVVAA